MNVENSYAKEIVETVILFEVLTVVFVHAFSCIIAE